LYNVKSKDVSAVTVLSRSQASPEGPT